MTVKILWKPAKNEAQAEAQERLDRRLAYDGTTPGLVAQVQRLGGQIVDSNHPALDSEPPSSAWNFRA